MFPKYIHTVVIVLLLLTSCRSTEPAVPEYPEEQEIQIPIPEPAPELRYLPEKKEAVIHKADIDSLIGTMSMREKIGQLFFVPMNGTFRNDHDQRFLEWKRLISNYKVGGIIFMAGDIYGQAMMTQKMQELSDLPLWISQDMEFGAAMRVQGTTRFTPAMGIAATGNPDNAFIKGQITAREAKALGVHQIYAPVLDVNNNPANPVINVRSYSADPDLVIQFGEAFIRGIESEGVLATAKHFPGHGDTNVDSHLALPVIRHDYTRLDSLELRPFRSAIQNGLRSVMTAHIAFPNISSNPETPGTLDPNILNGILVDTLGFDGLIVTDGLEMSGITSRYSPGDAVVRALKAGADIMLISPDEMTAVYEVEKAVERGQLSEERIDHSVQKILQLKKEHGLFESVGIDIHDLSRQIQAPEYRTAADRIARESITLLKNNRNILPIRDMDYQRVAVVAVSDDQSGTTGSVLAREMRKYHADVTFHVLDRRTSSEEKQKILADVRSSDLLVIGSFIFVRSHQPMQLTEDQRMFLRQLENLRKPSVLIAFGNPYVLNELEGADVHLLAWSGSAHQVQQTVPALFGGSKISGRLPVDIPGMYDIGAGLTMPHSGLRLDYPESAGLSTDSLMVLDEIMQTAIEDSVFPGGTIAVVKDGVIAWNKGYGYHDYNKTLAVQESDIFDLASLTKVIATTTAIMKLHDEGKLNLDDPVARYIPEFNTSEKNSITIRQLLLHTSGLPAFRIYVDRLHTRNEIIQAIRNEPLENKPGEEYVYSDLGFILLGEIVEQISGLTVDRYMQSNFYYPMGMYAAHFNPSRLGGWMRRRIPPTEIDHIYGRDIVQGLAHDERAFFMDGIAGHAGLFASAQDLAAWAQMMLNKGTYKGREYLRPETIELFTGHTSNINHRGLGFDRKSDGFSTAGTLSGMQTFGHTGFTGTSIWIDPEARIAVILLTNRTFPYRSYGSEIRNVRPAVFDAVMRSIITQ